jgi:hypothetical protein
MVVEDAENLQTSVVLEGFQRLPFLVTLIDGRNTCFYASRPLNQRL